MKEYIVKKIGSTVYVLNAADRVKHDKTRLLNANFQGTGFALCGVLQKGESLTAWMKKLKKAEADRNVEPTKKKKYVKKEITNHSS